MVCTTLKNGAAISLVAFLVLIPAAVLCFVLREKLNLSAWITALICTFVSLILASLSTYVIRIIAPEITDSLGIYLHLTAAFGIVAAVVRGKPVRSPGTAALQALRYGAVFTLCALSLSAVREILAYGQLWGVSMGIGYTLAGARTPFFGLILTGLLLAFAQYVMRLAYIRRHMSEE